MPVCGVMPSQKYSVTPVPFYCTYFVNTIDSGFITFISKVNFNTKNYSQTKTRSVLNIYHLFKFYKSKKNVILLSFI
jgi:hypothetical protein